MRYPGGLVLIGVCWLAIIRRPDASWWVALILCAGLTLLSVRLGMRLERAKQATTGGTPEPWDAAA